MYLAVALFFVSASHHGGVMPAQQPPISGAPATTTASTLCTDDYPCFNPWGYAIDTVIPIINVHQADFWGPDATKPWGRTAVWVTYLGTIIGWLLSALAVAGYTGLVRNGGTP